MRKSRNSAQRIQYCRGDTLPSVKYPTVFVGLVVVKPAFFFIIIIEPICCCLRKPFVTHPSSSTTLSWVVSRESCINNSNSAITNREIIHFNMVIPIFSSDFQFIDSICILNSFLFLWFRFACFAYCPFSSFQSSTYYLFSSIILWYVLLLFLFYFFRIIIIQKIFLI